MAQPNPRFEVVEEPDPSTEPESTVALAGLMLALKALSQRALVALDACSVLFVVGLVWLLWLRFPDPDANQLVALGMFAIFALLACVIHLFRRRK